MAKTTSWLGTTNTSWNTAGNWSNGIPVSTDTAIIAKGATRALATDLNRTADDATGLDLALLIVENGHKYPVGTSGERLAFAGTKVIIDAGVDVWLNSDNAAHNNGIARIITRNPSAFVDLVNTGEAGPSWENSAGEWNVTWELDTFFLPAIYMIPEYGAASFTLTNNAVGATGGGEIHQFGGEFTFYNTGDDTIELILSGGTFNFMSGRVSTMRQSGGTFFFDATTGSLLGTARLMGGLFDTTRTAGTKTATSIWRSHFVEFVTNKDFFTTDNVLGE